VWNVPAFGNDRVPQSRPLKRANSPNREIRKKYSEQEEFRQQHERQHQQERQELLQQPECESWRNYHQPAESVQLLPNELQLDDLRNEEFQPDELRTDEHVPQHTTNVSGEEPSSITLCANITKKHKNI
jgi:hypothetical protein